MYFVFSLLKIIEMQFMEITESRDNFTVYINRKFKELAKCSAIGFWKTWRVFWQFRLKKRQKSI